MRGNLSDKKKVWCASIIFSEIDLMGPQTWYYVNKMKKPLAPGQFLGVFIWIQILQNQCIFAKIDRFQPRIARLTDIPQKWACTFWNSQGKEIPKSTGSFLWVVCEPSNSRSNIARFCDETPNLDSPSQEPVSLRGVIHDNGVVPDGQNPSAPNPPIYLSSCQYDISVYVCIYWRYFFARTK